MSAPFTVELGSGRTAMAVRVEERSQLPAALVALGLEDHRAVVVVVGGAGGLDAAELDRLRPLFERAIVPAAEWHGAFVVDGGTDSGVMRLLGRSRVSQDATFPLVGVAARGTVSYPGAGQPREDAAPLDPCHSHFVLVPGSDWGAESPWIAEVGTELAGRLPSVTVLVNGGEIAYGDVGHSLAANRPVLAVAGSGRTADELAAAARGRPADPRAARLVASPLVRVVSLDETIALRRSLDTALGGASAGAGDTREPPP